MERLNDFYKVISYLPQSLAEKLRALPPEFAKEIYEIRLRIDLPVVLINKNGANFLYNNSRVSLIYSDNSVKINLQELNETFNRICEFSVYTNAKSISQGFVNLEGGHRAGICGSAVCDKDGNITAIRDISSINLRIAHEYKGAADIIYETLFKEKLHSIIIGGAPSTGKTTILRDLARQLSGAQRGDFYKTSIADERGEIAAAYNSRPQKDVGFSDVLSGFPKEKAILQALRTLSPDVIICDEVGSLREVNAVCEGLNSGVNFVVSAHMQSEKDLFLRPALKELVKSGAFSYLVMLKSGSVSTVSKIYNIKELIDENSRSNTFNADIYTLGCNAVSNNDSAS